MRKRALQVTIACALAAVVGLVLTPRERPPHRAVRNSPAKQARLSHRVAPARGAPAAPPAPTPVSREMRVDTQSFERLGDGSVEGRVVDADGVPIEGADVWQCGESTSRIARSAADGTFRIELLAPGPLVLAASRSNRIPQEPDRSSKVAVDVPRGAHVRGIELRLPFRLADCASFRGVVVDEIGRPVSGAWVLVGDVGAMPDPDLLFVRGAIRQSVASVLSVADGTFEVPLVSRGARDVLAYAGGFAPSDLPEASSPARVVLRATDPASFAVAGVVCDTDGCAVPEALVTVFEVAVVQEGTPTYHRTVHPDAGRFLVERIPGHLAEAELLVTAWAPGYAPAFADSASHVELVLDPLVALDLDVREPGGEPVSRFDARVWSRTGLSPRPGAEPFERSRLLVPRDAVALEIRAEGFTPHRRELDLAPHERHRRLDIVLERDEP